MNGACAIALTGGIASGKSAVSQRFAGHGVPVFDADLASRELVAPGQAALDEIIHAFGTSMRGADGTLDRARLRTRVFADAQARLQLEAILHPRIRARLLEQVAQCRSDYCILAIPLFAECIDDYRWVSRVLCTDAPRDVQRQRLLHRAGLDPATADNMLDAQAARQQRLQLADDVIDNTGALATLDGIVRRLHARYQQLARSHARG